MDTTAIINLVMQIFDLVVKYGPGAIADVENIWANLKLALQSATNGTPLTADQQTQYDAALKAGNDALNGAIANRADIEAKG